MLALLIAAAAAFAVTGELTQLPGTAGCVSIDGTGGACTNGKSLDEARSVAVSPDGKSVYVATRAEFAGGVAVFARDTTTGELTQLSGQAGCVSELGGGPCADGKALNTPTSVTASPDGKNVYVSSSVFDTVAVFARDTTTGALTQLAGTAGCVSDTGTTGSGDTCADGKALDGPASVAVSQDGKNGYVASQGSDAVALFARDTTTGALTQLGCVRDNARPTAGCRRGKALDGAAAVTVSPDDKSVYVASEFSRAIAVFRRNTTTGDIFQPPAACISEDGSGGTCADGKALAGARSVVVKPDGKRVYVASTSSSAVAVFSRNATNSALAQLPGTAGCVSETGSGGSCRDGKALGGANSLAVSGDGQSVYVTSDGVSHEDDFFEHGAVAVFKHSQFSGLSQLAGTAGCVSETGSAGNCADGRALVGATSVAVSPDDKDVYVASFDSDAVDVFAREPAP